MAIYTRTGDGGKTSLFGGKRVLKSDIRVETYGTLDELNSILGIVLAFLPGNEKALQSEIKNIQNNLFDIGSYLATPDGKVHIDLPRRVGDFEKIIDEETTNLPDLTHFILPGGGMAGAHLHHARTVTRRVERQLVALMQKEEVDKNVLMYINRLSDLLFSMARYINFKEKKEEILWNHS